MFPILNLFQPSYSSDPVRDLGTRMSGSVTEDSEKKATLHRFLDQAESPLLLWKVILASVYPLGAGAPVEGAFPSHGLDQTGYSGRAATQP
jgi:hypothetical protein